MKNGRTRRFVAVSMLAVCSLFGTGCSLSGLTQNAWFGFGAGLGAIPANLVADFIVANFLGVIDDTAP